MENSVKDFELHLKQQGLSTNSIDSYLYAVKYFLENYDLELEGVLEYKGYLLERFKPKTVNLRIQGLNKFLKFSGNDDLCLKAIKIQQKNYLEDVISYADYLFLKRKLKKMGI